MTSNISASTVEKCKSVVIPQEEFEDLLEYVAEKGATHALQKVGLDGDDAAHDIRELRSLLEAFNETKKTIGLTIVKLVITGIVMASVAGAFVKLKLFGGQ
ncbi:Transmembrane protein [Gammaproteobacteria bacterium]